MNISSHFSELHSNIISPSRVLSIVSNSLCMGAGWVPKSMLTRYSAAKFLSLKESNCLSQYVTRIFLHIYTHSTYIMDFGVPDDCILEDQYWSYLFWLLILVLLVYLTTQAAAHRNQYKKCKPSYGGASNGIWAWQESGLSP
jgi:hypothetical protein